MKKPTQVKIDAKLKKQWVDALRSGKYLQGQSALRVKDELDGKDYFCCLGVLCDLVATEKWAKKPRDGVEVCHNRQSALPAKDLQKKLGLDQRFAQKEGSHKVYDSKSVDWDSIDSDHEYNGPFWDDVGSVADYLAELNDSGESFKKIANFIEKNL